MTSSGAEQSPLTDDECVCEEIWLVELSRGEGVGHYFEIFSFFWLSSTKEDNSPLPLKNSIIRPPGGCKNTKNFDVTATF